MIDQPGPGDEKPFSTSPGSSYCSTKQRRKRKLEGKCRVLLDNSTTRDKQEPMELSSTEMMSRGRTNAGSCI